MDSQICGQSLVRMLHTCIGLEEPVGPFFLQHTSMTGHMIRSKKVPKFNPGHLQIQREKILIRNPEELLPVRANNTQLEVFRPS